MVESDQFVESPGLDLLMLTSRPAGGEWSDGEVLTSDRSALGNSLLVTDTSVPVLWKSVPLGVAISSTQKHGRSATG